MVVNSDWEDWLPRAIAEADPAGVAIWYLGCNGFALEASDGTTLFIDPYFGRGSPPRTIRMIPVPLDPADVEHVDAVLATHEHTDHVHGSSQAPLLTGHDSTFYGPDASVAVTEDQNWTGEWGVSDDQFAEVAEGDTFEVGAFTIHVEQAHDPDAEHPVSYVIEHPSGTFFHGGDTKPSDEFARIGEDYDIDLGVLAFGTVGNVRDKRTGEPKRTRWYNDENQIIEAASDLRLDRLLPSHWDMWKGLTADPKALHHHARTFEYPRTLELVEIGDRVEL